MSIYKLNIAFIITSSLLFNSLFAQTLDRSIRPKAGPTPVVQMGSSQSFTTTNGIKVFVVENHKSTGCKLFNRF